MHEKEPSPNVSTMAEDEKSEQHVRDECLFCNSEFPIVTQSRSQGLGSFRASSNLNRSSMGTKEHVGQRVRHAPVYFITACTPDTKPMRKPMILTFQIPHPQAIQLVNTLRETCYCNLKRHGYMTRACAFRSVKQYG